MPIFKKPSATVREIDIPSEGLTPGTGSPAVFIGTSRRGPAFVPVTVGDFKSFTTVFGALDSKRFGPIAAQEWLKNKSACSFIRVLGVGDGKKRTSEGLNAGKVTNAGFVVGSEQVQANGFVGKNAFATEGGVPGRTYFLGCFMSESNGSTIFSEVDAQTVGENKSVPVIRGILMAASGVSLTLNTEATAKNEPSEKAHGRFGNDYDSGLSYGDILVGDGDKQNFIVILNGYNPPAESSYSNTITASFLPNTGGPDGDESVKSIHRAFNTNPELLEKSGHLLYQFYDVPGVSQPFAEITGSGITHHQDTTLTLVKTDDENYKLYQTAFLLSASLGYNSGSASKSSYVGVPNFENFEYRYTNAASPFVMSQKLSGKRRDLFRVYAKDDGIAGAGNYKITISGITPAEKDAETKYCTFDLDVRRIDEPDDTQFLGIGFSQVEDSFAKEFLGPLSPRESFRGLNLDPSSPNFIAKVIGDQHSFYDFDKKVGGQKEVLEGLYAGISSLIRVELSEDVMQGVIEPEALPVGFRGLPHLVTSGSTIIGTSILSGTSVAQDTDSAGSLSSNAGIDRSVPASIIQFPVPMRESVKFLNADSSVAAASDRTWGMQFQTKNSPNDPNNLVLFSTSSLSYLTYMPDFHKSFQNPLVENNHGTPDIGGTVLDSDRYNNNMFSLEFIEVLTGTDKFPDPEQWASARYRRNGVSKGKLAKLENVDGALVLENSRFISLEDFSHNPTNDYLKFTFPLVGGFDGVNIFDKDKAFLTNDAAHRESIDSNQGGRRGGPTISAYNKALEILRNKTYTGHLLALPGIRVPTLTSEALDVVTDRFDMFYVMDMQERGPLNQVVTGSQAGLETTEKTNSVTNTRNAFMQDPDDSTFGATYFPDVFMPIESVSAEPIRMPPSIAAISIYSKLTSDHQKPYGTALTLPPGTASETVLDDKELEEFYQAGINVIQNDPNLPTTGPFIRSQATFGSKNSALSKIAIRRMVLEVRRRVKNALIDATLFEGNTRTQLMSAKGLVQEVLNTMSAAGAFKGASVNALEGKTAGDEEARRLRDEDVQNNVMRFEVTIVPKDGGRPIVFDLDSGEDG